MKSLQQESGSKPRAGGVSASGSRVGGVSAAGSRSTVSSRRSQPDLKYKHIIEQTKTKPPFR